MGAIEAIVLGYSPDNGVTPQEMFVLINAFAEISFQCKIYDPQVSISNSTQMEKTKQILQKVRVLFLTMFLI